MSALRELLLSFGIDVDDKGLKKADRSITGLIRAAADGFNEVTEAVGKIVGVIGDVAAFVGETISAGGAMADAAAAAGMTTEAYQRLGFIAGLAGVETDTLRQAVIRLQRSAIQASRGSGGELGDVYRRLGVSVRDASGQFKDGVTLFREVGLALNDVTSQTERAALAQQLFGRSGAQLLPIFASGEDGIARIEARFRELGGGMSGEFVAAADAADDAMAELSLAWTGLRSELVVALIPAIRDVTTFLADSVAWLVRLARTSEIVEATFIGLGIALGVLGALLAPVVIPGFLVLAAVAALVVGPIAFLVLLIDDLLVFMRGGKSVIGRFLDGLFGVGASKTILMAVRDAVRAIGVAFEVARVVGVALWKQLSGVVIQFVQDVRAGWREVEIWGAAIGGLLSNAFSQLDTNIAKVWSTTEAWIGIFRSEFPAAAAVLGQIVQLAYSAWTAFTGLGESVANAVRSLSGLTIGGVDILATARGIASAGQTTSSAAPDARPAAVTVPRQPRGRGGPRVTINTPVTVHAGRADARETARLVGQEVDRRIARTLRGAVASLEPQAPRPAP